MKSFMANDFLLDTVTSETLYHYYAKDAPIFDYHCHLTAKEIAEDKTFSNITDVWLKEDHYKWRLLRANGVPEKYITGEGTDKEKFIEWAKTLPHLMGNPVFHWTYLELRRCFGIEEILNTDSAERIWEETSRKLNSGEFSARNIIKRFNVKGLCTTDDPVDDLKYHKLIEQDASFDVKVLPTFRPDHALNAQTAAFPAWVEELERSADKDIENYETFLEALASRVTYFHEAGCRLSDHGLDSGFYEYATFEECTDIFEKARNGMTLTDSEAVKFRTAVLLYLAKRYAHHGWAMQLHIGGLRGANEKMVERVGPNTGFDSIADFNYAEDLSNILNELDKSDALPKTVIYNLNPRDNYMVAAMTGNFQSGIPGKIQFGTAWWFNDHIEGMEKQLRTLANTGVLSRFIGMVTDSRSLLSYTRHEYFRRVLCNMIGHWIEDGEIPNDIEWAGKLIENISFNNICDYLEIDMTTKDVQ